MAGISIREYEARLAGITAEMEGEGVDEASFEVNAKLRDVRCAASMEVDVASWSDFERFWRNNFSPTLYYALVDQFGEGSPIAKKGKDLIDKAIQFDKDLHGFYMDLKGHNNKPKTKPEPDGTDEALSALEEHDDDEE